jgi:DNA-binding NtrC family response regulator
MDGSAEAVQPAAGASPSAADLVGLGTRRIAALLAEIAAADAAVAVRLRASLADGPGNGVGDATVSCADPPAGPPAGPGAAAERFLVGESPAMQRVFREIRQFAGCDAPVLITGETGTGKELAARAIHERSRFAAGPFVAINCAGLPPSLISSELFGYEKGAFTGAVQRKIGRIEAAQGGSVFLDEIGDLAPELQPHLLRFLQEGTIERLGGHQPIAVSARVIAATHRPLTADIAQDRFREDLYYRLNVLRLHLPPLRERGEDIALLAQFFAGRFAPALGRPPRPLTEDALAAVRLHPWPGNIRELISHVRRAVVTASGDRLSAADLGLSIAERRRAPRGRAGPGTDAEPRAAPGTADGGDTAGDRTDDDQANGAFVVALAPGRPCPPLVETRRRLEKWLILAALKAHGDNVTLAADALGISRVTLYRLLEKHAVRVGPE